MYDQQFLQSVLKKGIFGPRNAIFGPKTKNHKNDKLINNQESLTSASHIFVYSSEPFPWWLTVAMAPIVMTKTNATSLYSDEYLYFKTSEYFCPRYFKKSSSFLSLTKSQVPL